MRTLAMIRYAQSLSITTLPPDAPEPNWASGGLFVASIRTRRERVVVCPATSVPGDVIAHGPFTAFEMATHVDPSQPGLLTRLAEAPGRVGISLMPFTTYDRGWILIPRADADRAERAWTDDGFTITHAEEAP